MHTIAQHTRPDEDHDPLAYIGDVHKHLHELIDDMATVGDCMDAGLRRQLTDGILKALSCLDYARGLVADMQHDAEGGKAA